MSLKAPLYIFDRDGTAFSLLYNRICDYLDDKYVDYAVAGGVKGAATEHNMTLKISHISSKMFHEVILIEIKSQCEKHGYKVKYYRKKRNKFWIVEMKK
jgi:hypothetical protein